MDLKEKFDILMEKAFGFQNMGLFSQVIINGKKFGYQHPISGYVAYSIEGVFIEDYEEFIDRLLEAKEVENPMDIDKCHDEKTIVSTMLGFIKQRKINRDEIKRERIFQEKLAELKSIGYFGY